MDLVLQIGNFSQSGAIHTIRNSGRELFKTETATPDFSIFGRHQESVSFEAPSQIEYNAALSWPRAKQKGFGFETTNFTGSTNLIENTSIASA